MTVLATVRSPWPHTVFDTSEWLDAWSRNTVEHFTAQDGDGPGIYAVAQSPFWDGYAADAKLPLPWDRPLLTVSSLYAFYGPAHLLEEPESVKNLVAKGRELSAEWDTAGVLIANLPQEAAVAWSMISPPDATARLDVAYHRRIGAGDDPVVGDVSARVRANWRRRWRRATEQGLRVIEDEHPAPEPISQVIGLANASATRHGWPAVYDQATAEAVLQMPGARLIRAEWSGQTVAGFIALEHAGTLNLWAGGTHETLLREVSPYQFLLYELLAHGAERGLEQLEFGRGNDTFKRSHGFEGTETWSLWYGRDPGQVSRYGPALEQLSDRLSGVMGLDPGPLALTAGRGAHG
jgi:hypothetical protein